jgi:hypothetical protein
MVNFIEGPDVLKRDKVSGNIQITDVFYEVTPGLGKGKVFRISLFHVGRNLNRVTKMDREMG